MSYNLQQSIESSRKTIIRGFRQDETHSALCSHLFTMIRGNRQHRRAFLISLLNLFDDSAVSKHSLNNVLALLRLKWCFLTCQGKMYFVFLHIYQQRVLRRSEENSTMQCELVPSADSRSCPSPLFFLPAEDGSKHAAVYSRQSRLFPIPEPGGASLHHAPHRHHPVCFWQQLVANLQRGRIVFLKVACM